MTDAAYVDAVVTWAALKAVGSLIGELVSAGIWTTADRAAQLRNGLHGQCNSDQSPESYHSNLLLASVIH